MEWQETVEALGGVAVLGKEVISASPLHVKLSKVYLVHR
jgi:hypothetical protein